MSSFSILKRLLLEPKVLLFLFLDIKALDPITSFAMYPDLSTLDHELGSGNSAWSIDGKQDKVIMCYILNE